MDVSTSWEESVFFLNCGLASWLGSLTKECLLI